MRCAANWRAQGVPSPHERDIHGMSRDSLVILRGPTAKNRHEPRPGVSGGHRLTRCPRDQSRPALALQHNGLSGPTKDGATELDGHEHAYLKVTVSPQ